MNLKRGDRVGNFINEPIEHDWTNEEIICEYNKLKNKRMVARIFCITVRELNAILDGKNTISDCDSDNFI